MSTAIAPLPATTPPARMRKPSGPVALAAAALGSMKLTVVLIVLLALLTWLGTLAQVDDGIYYVQRDYFESWIVWPRLGPVSFPLPGAVPVLGLLFVNLIVGGIARMRWSLRNAGILITHFGIALLLAAGGIKLGASYAGHMSIQEGATDNSILSFQEWELALMWQDGDNVMERVVPGAAIERATGSAPLRLAAEGLPFTVEVSHFLEHCQPVPKGPMVQAATPVVDGAFLYTERAMTPKDRDQKLAGCYATVTDTASGQKQQGILWAADLLPTNVGAPHRPWVFEAGGRTWGLELRHRLWSLPFDVRLDRFKKSEHPGTTMARDFSSFVTVVDRDGQSRPAHIYMNEPLRKDGYVFYQTSFGPDPARAGGFYSTFEVANNPSDQWPKWACYVIAVGLLIHFTNKLVRFVAAENRRRKAAEVVA
ncbi:MAG: cytochrome c biogenesis protein ResB [Planctomycetota bacterium]